MSLITTQNRYVELLVTGSGNTLDQFIAIGSLLNIPEFSNDLSCSSGSVMNPVNKWEML